MYPEQLPVTSWSLCPPGPLRPHPTLVGWELLGLLPVLLAEPWPHPSQPRGLLPRV